MRKALLSVALSFFVMIPAYGQANFARVSGTVQDATGALIPGVTVVATDVNTGIVTMELSNESGTYNFASLLPGTYKISVSLLGFQTQTVTDLKLGIEQYRYNFTLQVAQAATSVDVVISGETLLRTSSSSVGDVLSQVEVANLPIVGNNVLDLVRTLAGVTGADAIGGVGTGESVRFAGISSNQVTTVRDGIMVQDVRYPNGIISATVLNPDLVGEIRLILAPVDAEIGRGNGSIQITTRSGTNRYTGSATWSGRNSAFNANTFERNRANPPGLIPYYNSHQYTIAYGGPILKNKTFFYAVFDGTNVRSRTEITALALTPCARNGIYRYFDFWNNGNANATTVATGATPSRPVVDVGGNPITPDVNPVFTTIPTGAPAGTTSGGPYTGQLRYISVFGPLLNTPTKADCSDAQVDRTRAWDTYRVARDPSGYVDRMMAFMPSPNNYTLNNTDGLNTAGIRWLRTNRGADNLFGSGQEVGERNQINLKIDHNFNQNNKFNVSGSYERNFSTDSQPLWPGSFPGPAYRRPFVITSGFTSTLSSSLLNEARFGLRVSGSNSMAPYDYAPNIEGINKLLPAPLNGIRILPRLGGGTVSFQGTNPLSPNQGGVNSYTLRDRSPIFTFTDNVSWTKGAHSFRMGAELRLVLSKSEQNGNGAQFTSVTPTGGNSAGAPVRTNAVDAISATNPAMAFIKTNDEARARDLLSFLSGSLVSVSEWFFMMDPKKTDAFEDYRTYPYRIRYTKRREISGFFKDDWKVQRDLTLNLGVRYEYYGASYIGSGLTLAPIGGGNALFGISGRNFDRWLQPPAVGPGAASAYDATLLTQVQFVGPNSQLPKLSAIPHDYVNFGPAIGFAWQVPWFGEGKTTVRGGYQINFLPGQNASAIEGAIGNPPGSSVGQVYAPTAGSPDPYLDMTDLGRSVSVPIPVSFNPIQAPGITSRGGGGTISFTGYDPHFVSPYVQNLTLSITRSVNRHISADLRYVGTLSVKQIATQNLNAVNFTNNPLFAELDSVRKGTDNTPLLDRMFQGLNLCFTGSTCSTQYVDATGATVTAQYGAIGTSVAGVAQTPGYQMRLNPTFNTNLANGDYLAVMTSLNTYNGNLTNPGGIFGLVMRNSGYFPENFFVANPQLAAANYTTNFGHNNYHSFQGEVTLRPIHGIGGSATYTWSKAMSLVTGLSNPLDRSEVTLQAGNRPHELRMNGLVELPIGPNKMFFGNSSGWLARALERWQTSWILNLSSAPWANITGLNRMYAGATGVPDIVNPIDFDSVRNYKWGNLPSGSQLNANVFGGEQFATVPDPQCNVVTSKQSFNQAVGSTTARCTQRALARIVPAGTPGSFLLSDGTNRSAVIALQNAQPGTKGNLGYNVIKTFGSMRFDASASKTFNISESRSFQVRIDVTNVLNHPTPGNPSLDINGNNTFGNITTKTGTRVFQGQLRLNF